MVAHQAVGVDLKSGLAASFRQRFDEVLAVDIGLKEVSLSIGPVHHMVNGTGVLYSQFAWHAKRLPQGPGYVQTIV
jgi:hypothetical protein